MALTMRAMVIHGLILGTLVGLPSSARALEGKQQMFLSEKDIVGVIGQVLAEHGQRHAKQAEQGVRQAARLWTAADGTAADFARFAVEQFATGKQRDLLFERFEHKLEQIAGHLDALDLNLKLELDEDRGPLLPVDMLFARFSPATHVIEDLFKTKLAFVALLNFPEATLKDMLQAGNRWTRRRWAETRLAQGFAHRVPAEVEQAVADAYAAADEYVSNTNIRMDRVLGPDGKPMFRKGLRLISHWGLRDELRALYADPKGNLARQEMIYLIMQRIIHQQIPAVVIDNPKVSWDPVANTVDGKPAEREADLRYRFILDTYRALKKLDPYYPDAPSHIDRRFLLQREIPEAEVEQMLDQVLRAPVGKQVADLIGQRLGRPLRPYDIWYDGFKPRGAIGERELDRLVQSRFKTAAEFEQALPDTLSRLGFDPKTAQFLAEHIEVDPARGAGHAHGPQMRGEKAHLRTRLPAGGMDYKGFNIAMHELGHNVEQVFSLYRVDSTLMQGVPNTAFTEGFAFVFQDRDLQVLGVAKPDAKTEAQKALDIFWATREIGGVALVDMRMWRWMYANPDATPAQLREAVVRMAQEVWNTYFADAFGEKDSPILAVYAHMVGYPLYLPDYPMGHIIAFQVEDYFRTHPLASEMERMCAQGRLAPNLWMKGAVGQKISTRPLIQAATQALKTIH